MKKHVHMLPQEHNLCSRNLPLDEMNHLNSAILKVQLIQSVLGTELFLFAVLI